MKKALLVGINYVGTANELQGCLNDVTNMQALLAQTYGFTDIITLTEAQATTVNIKTAILALIAGTVVGDVIVFHYSGHGSQIPSATEADKLDEVLCPVDFNWTTNLITDDWLNAAFSAVPNGVNATVVLDCCHSGDALEQQRSYKEIITNPLYLEEKYIVPPQPILATIKARGLEIDTRDVNVTVMLIAGCQSDQTSADALIGGVRQGAATASLIAAAKANPELTYIELITGMQAFMVTNGYSQTPTLDGSTTLHNEKFVQPWDFTMAVSTPVTPPTVVTKTSSDNTTLYIAIGFVLLCIIAFLIQH